MGIRRHLTYANVTATLALVLALGAGGAYAVEKIGSEDIRDDSIVSADLRNTVAVKGVDVKRGAIGGREVIERSLAGSGIVATGGDHQTDCDVVESSRSNCASTTVRLRRAGRIVAIATGDFFAIDGGASADCKIQVDGRGDSLGQTPGVVANNTSSTATDGFARTLVTDPIPRGRHRAALRCSQVDSNDAVVGTPTITAFGITGR